MIRRRLARGEHVGDFHVEVCEIRHRRHLDAERDELVAQHVQRVQTPLGRRGPVAGTALERLRRTHKKVHGEAGHYVSVTRWHLQAMEKGKRDARREPATTGRIATAPGGQRETMTENVRRVVTRVVSERLRRF